MDFIDEEHIAGLQVGEHCREIAGSLEDRTRGDMDLGFHLVGDDVRQCGLAEAGGAEEEGVIERLGAIAGAMKTPRLVVSRVWPTNSASRRGRRVSSNGRSSGCGSVVNTSSLTVRLYLIGPTGPNNAMLDARHSILDAR
jgi:hypothetical protein